MFRLVLAILFVSSTSYAVTHEIRDAATNKKVEKVEPGKTYILTIKGLKRLMDSDPYNFYRTDISVAGQTVRNKANRKCGDWQNDIWPAGPCEIEFQVPEKLYPKFGRLAKNQRLRIYLVIDQYDEDTIAIAGFPIQIPVMSQEEFNKVTATQRPKITGIKACRGKNKSVSYKVSLGDAGDAYRNRYCKSGTSAEIAKFRKRPKSPSKGYTKVKGHGRIEGSVPADKSYPHLIHCFYWKDEDNRIISATSFPIYNYPVNSLKVGACRTIEMNRASGESPKPTPSGSR